MPMSQDPSTNAKVNNSATQDFTVPPELIYDRLFKSTDVSISVLEWLFTQLQR